MNDREIIVCNNVICNYSQDGGSFEGDIWWHCWPVHLFLHCDPDNAIERLILKLAFETVYRDSEIWTVLARKYACNRFFEYGAHLAPRNRENQRQQNRYN